MEVNLQNIIDATWKHYGVKIQEETLMKALEFSREVTFKKGTIILGMGEQMKNTCFILNGIVRSYYLDKEGNDVTKNFMKEFNFCVGESIFTDEESGQGFEALEKCDCLEFDAKELKEFILKDATLTKIYIKILEENLIYKMNRENGFQIKSATERYLDFKKNFKNIEERVTQSYVASYLGVTPVTLSRIRRTIREYIYFSRKKRMGRTEATEKAMLFQCFEQTKIEFYSTV